MPRKHKGAPMSASAAPVASKRAASDLELSREQRDVVTELVDRRRNVLVIAKAGSGKSSVALAAAQQYFARHQERTLLITYNARLKDETRARIERLKLDHAVEAHSYHACASKFFVPRRDGGTADNALIHEANQVTAPLVPLDFGLVVIDEAQDMNPLYADFVKHMLRLNTRRPVMLVVGDPFQRIFGFNGSSCDFMVQPRVHFGSLCREEAFATHHLTICWRITHEMSHFINVNLNPCNLVHSAPTDWWRQHGETVTAWWGKGIRANPQRPPAPESVKIAHGWGSKGIVDETQRLFAEYGDDEVALLAFSLKGERTPIRAIVDRLGKNSHENWAVLAGTSNASEEVLTGKRLASTIHRMKGLERRGIVVCGMDAFVEKLYPNDPLEHFNVFYVACTRAKDRLVVNITGTPYATLRCSALKDVEKVVKQPCEVRHLVGYVPFDRVLSVPEELFQARVTLAFPEKALALDRQACLVGGRAAGTVEDLSPFMSRAISFKLMLLIHGQLFRFAVDDQYDRDMVLFVRRFYEQVTASPSQVTWPALVQYSVAYETLHSKYKHLWRQLQDYEAITPSALLERCTVNALNLLWLHAHRQGLIVGCSGDASTVLTEFDHITRRAEQLRPWVEFEVPFTLPFAPAWFVPTYTGQVSGVVELLFNRNTVVGIECSDAIPAERGLELALYSSLRHLVQSTPGATIMILTNTAQLVTITLNLKALRSDVPLPYELLHRSIRRKLQLPAVSAEDLHRDFSQVKKTK